MRDNGAALDAQKSSKNGRAAVSAARSSIRPVPNPQRSPIYGQKYVSGMPPCLATSR